MRKQRNQSQEQGRTRARSRAVILPPCSALLGPHLECCAQFWVPGFGKVLERVQRKAVETGKGVEHKSDQEWLGKPGC